MYACVSDLYSVFQTCLCVLVRWQHCSLSPQYNTSYHIEDISEIVKYTFIMQFTGRYIYVKHTTLIDMLVDTQRQGCLLSRIGPVTHATDKFTHAFKKNHTHTHAILKIENNLLFVIIVRLIVTLFIVFLL